MAKMDKREQYANQVLMRGHASIDELLFVSFGEWPPRGLDIVHENKNRVNLTQSLHEFHSTSSDKTQPPWHSKLYEFLTTAGYARTGGERNIYVNNFLTSIGADKVSTMAHETAHILQGDHYWRARDLMGKDGLSSRYALPNTLNNIIVENSIEGHFKQGPVRNIVNKIMDATGFGLDYLKSGLEVQARLQEALIAGYQHWERLPQDKTEFYFAMKSVGFDLPQDIRKSMDENPNKASLEKTFPAIKSRFAPKLQCVSDIHTLQSSLTDQGKNNFWHMAMPGLYGDLIEMFGDKLGRERMGFGVNETHALRKRHEEDLQNIGAQKWNFAKTEAAGEYAYIHLDPVSQKDRDILVKALDNQYIGVKVQQDPPPSNHTWLFVTGEKGIQNLKTALDKSPQNQPAAAPAVQVQASRKMSS